MLMWWRLASFLAVTCWTLTVMTILFGASLPDAGSPAGNLGLRVAVGLMASPFVVAGTAFSLAGAILRRRAMRRRPVQAA